MSCHMGWKKVKQNPPIQNEYFYSFEMEDYFSEPPVTSL